MSATNFHDSFYNSIVCNTEFNRFNSLNEKYINIRKLDNNLRGNSILPKPPHDMEVDDFGGNEHVVIRIDKITFLAASIAV